MKRGRLAAKLWTVFVCTALLFSLAGQIAPSTAYADRGAIDLWKSIKPLTTIASAMNTGAHPDDEHSAMLAYLSLGQGVFTSSVIANRGEGGQNEIGSELGNALGIIRTRELQEASKITNVHLEHLSEKLDDPIYDFGFSKSPDETLAKWGESVAYERLIRKIREIRPDVVIPSFLNEPSTHGHHRAINVITVRAFKDAADPSVYPEQLKEGLEPWQIKKLYVPATEKDYDVRIPVGDYDQIYGASYVQLGEESRFMHKSQGMGRNYDEGPSYDYYRLESSTAPAGNKQESSFFEGIAFTFADLAKEAESKQGGQAVAQQLKLLQKDADEVIAAYPDFAAVAREVHEMKSDVNAAISRVNASSLDHPTKVDLLHRLEVKADQLNKASLEATSIVAKLRPESGELVAGQTAKMTVTAYNGGTLPVENVQLSLRVPAGWQLKALTNPRFAKLNPNATATVTYQVSVPNNAATFDPYAKPIVVAEMRYEAYRSMTAVTIAPEETVAVLPAYSLSLDPSETVLNTLKADQPIPVNVTVKNYRPGKAKANVSLQVPEGWTVEPAQQELTFGAKGEVKSLAFTVHPSATVSNGSYTISAVARDGSSSGSRKVQVIEYPHIGKTYYVQPATLKIQAFDLHIPDKLKVGYVSSGFDNIDQYLRQLGIQVDELDQKAIESGNLNQYDTIVLGIRAYGFRPELIASNQRLLKYVEDGGNLVVQYHKPEDNWQPSLAPYPITIGTPLIQWRVTDESSKVTMLAPDHPLFTTPNPITEEDWNHWVQDRSAYNPSEWGNEYTELISNGDPGEKEFTGTFLTANYGKGTYTYSSLVWYREIPSLVPGAIRLFVNMISLHQ